jgi:hypothetical protein
MVEKSKSNIMIRVSTEGTKAQINRGGEDDERKLREALLRYFEKKPDTERLVARTMPTFWVYTKGTKGAPDEKWWLGRTLSQNYGRPIVVL